MVVQASQVINIGETAVGINLSTDTTKLRTGEVVEISWSKPKIFDMELDCTVEFHSSDSDVIEMIDATHFVTKRSGIAEITMYYEYSDESLAEIIEAYPSYEFLSDELGRFIPVQVGTEIYRLYNPNSGEHFFTSSLQETRTLIKAGWTDEGYAWTAPVDNPDELYNIMSIPVYRLYNPNAGDHHYTIDKNETDTLKKAGWNFEGIAWYSEDNSKSEPVYRSYNPNAKAGAHHYTPNIAEFSFLISKGWKNENIGWYALRIH